MNNTLDLIGTVSNAIAAICAVVAIWITITNYRKEQLAIGEARKEEKIKNLYKEYVLDSFLKQVEGTILQTNRKLYEIAQNGTCDEIRLKNIYDSFLAEAHGWTTDVAIIKMLANNSLYSRVKDLLYDILELYGKIINESTKRKRVSIYFEKEIKEQLANLKRELLLFYKVPIMGDE